MRTSAEIHHRGVQALWVSHVDCSTPHAHFHRLQDRLAEAGYIYKGKHSGWYSISDEAFYTDSQIRSHIDPKTGSEVKVSVETGNVVEWTEEENYKFKLSAFKDRLKNHFEKNPRGELFSCVPFLTTLNMYFASNLPSASNEGNHGCPFVPRFYKSP